MVAPLVDTVGLFYFQKQTKAWIRKSSRRVHNELVSAARSPHWIAFAGIGCDAEDRFFPSLISVLGPPVSLYVKRGY